ncbi:MAG TPA: phage portal protein, partial [Hyphomicrobium sp.]|nr:phage portal protein [Hyphomicrobium sp.]
MSKSKRHKRKAHAVERKSAPAALNLWGLDDFFARNTIAGPSINPETAMRCTPVACCVSLISDTVGNIPAKVYADDGKGGKVADASHPAYRLVHDEATPFMSAAQFRTQITADTLLNGNGIARANRLEDGRVVELNWLDPKSVTVETDDRGEPWYRVANRTSATYLPWTEVLHIPAFSFDSAKGVAPIQLAREAIALALIMEQHASQLFANGSRPAGVLKFPEDIGAEASARMKASWQEATSGANTGSTPVLEEGGDFKPMQFSSVDAQFMELKTKQIDEIARAFRVPPSMIFEF